MKLNIRVLNRAKHWRIDVSPHINISELKQEVEKYCKMKLNKANMYYRSMELSKDEQTLKDYGVVAESSIIVRFTTIIILENLVKRSSLDKIITEMMNNKNLPKLKRKYNYNCGVKNASIDCTNLDSILESLLIAYEYMTPALEELINNASDSVLPKLYNEKLDEIVWSISPEQFDEIVKASLLIKEVNKCRVLEYATKLPKFPIDSFICAINQSIRFSITAGIFRIYLKEDVVTQLALLYKALHDAIQRINQLSDCRKTDQLVYFVKEHKSKNLQDLQNNDSRNVPFTEMYQAVRGINWLIPEQYYSRIDSSNQEISVDFLSNACSEIIMNPKSTNHTKEYKDIGYKGNSMPSPVQFDLHKKLNYYIYLSDRPYPKMNTTFEVRYFELEHDPPSKEIPHFKNMKVKDEKNENAMVANPNTKEFEISTDAIEVRVFEFKRKNVSEEKKIMQKLQSKLHPQPNVPNHRQENPTRISQSPSPFFHNEVSQGNLMGKQTRVGTISHKDGTNFDDYKLPQCQTHMYLQHCAVNTAETCTRSFYNTTPSPVKLSSEEKHDRKVNFTRNKPKSAPASKLRNNSNTPCQQFRELFRDNKAPWSDANSSVTSSELYTCTRNSITYPQLLNKKCTCPISNTCEDGEGFQHHYAQIRCRGGDSNFRSKGKICDSNQTLSTANMSVQCNFFEAGKKCPTESQKMMSTFCSNNISTPRYEEKQLNDSNYMLYASHKTHKGRLSKYLPKPIDGPQVYACHKEENRRRSSSLCKPLIINNKSDTYKRFYARNGINSCVTEQDRDLELCKLKSTTSSLCENKIYMDNVCSTIFDNFKCAQTSDFYHNNAKCLAFDKDKFKWPEKETSKSNYLHQCFIDSDSYQDELPTNIIYRSQSSLDTRNEGITKYSKSSVNHYELVTDNVTAISNPKIFKIDNYQDRNVYHIKDNECYADVNGAWNEENQFDEKLKKHYDQSRYSIVVSSLSDAGTSTDNCELQCCNQNIYHHANLKDNDKINKEQITKSNCDKSTQLPPITYRSRPLFVKKC